MQVKNENFIFARPLVVKKLKPNGATNVLIKGKN